MFIKQKQAAVERGKLKNKEELRTGQPKYQFNTKIGKDQKIFPEYISKRHRNGEWKNKKKLVVEKI